MSREHLPNISHEKLDKAAKSAKKLLNVLSAEARNPLAHKPLRYGVLLGGITYFGYLYYRGRDQVEGEFRAGAMDDSRSIEFSGTFIQELQRNESGEVKAVIEPTVDTLSAPDEDLDVLGEKIAETNIVPYQITPESDD